MATMRATAEQGRKGRVGQGSVKINVILMLRWLTERVNHD